MSTQKQGSEPDLPPTEAYINHDWNIVPFLEHRGMEPVLWMCNRCGITYRGDGQPPSGNCFPLFPKNTALQIMQQYADQENSILRGRIDRIRSMLKLILTEFEELSRKELEERITRVYNQ